MELPDDFKKMELEIMLFSDKQFNAFRKQILRLLLRDYYVFYSFKKYKGYYRLFFYCRPNDESALTYRIGVYNQTMFNYHKPSDIIKSDHIVSKDYVEKYCVPFEEKVLE